MKIFDYELPEQLIAQYPLGDRTHSRMLVVDCKANKIEHRMFGDLPHFIGPGDRMVFNHSKVQKSRLFGVRPSGGKVECFLLEPLSLERQADCLIRSSARKENLRFQIGEHLWGEVVGPGREQGTFRVRFQGKQEDLERAAQVSLPPYMDRAATPQDEVRYQTVYAKEKGSVAAPTAGLHFDEIMLERLKTLGVLLDYITLHVGYGTFQPIKAEQIEDHKMHREYFVVPKSVRVGLEETKKCNGKRIAVGTTTVRALESAARGAKGVEEVSGWTELYLYPGCSFLTVDAILTNFHQPKSSLLVLMAAFMGPELLKKAYEEAVCQKYRFLSYGDCMLVL